MTTFAQALMFVSSYAPLFGVFALLDTFGRGIPTGVCIVLACLGLAIPVVVLLAVHRLSPHPLNVESSQARDSDTLAYVATYLIPFAAIMATSGRERAAVGLFFIVLAVLFVRNELFYVNPLMAIFGYRLFQVVSPTGASVVLLGRRSFLRANTTVSARRLSSYIYLEA
jgi:hypothetical protein